jgi:hypothetical protein
MQINMLLETSKTFREYRFRGVIDAFMHQNPWAATHFVMVKLKEIVQVGAAKAKAKETYNTLEVLSLKHLKDIKKYNDKGISRRNLRVFYRKGCICASCGSEGIILVKKQKDNNIGWSVMTKDMVEMNIDHIIPKSKGGCNNLYNLQPMCAPCNTSKGNKVPKMVKAGEVGVDVGDCVFLKRFGKFINIGYVDFVDEKTVKTNCNRTSRLYKSCYNKNELYKLKNNYE